MKIYFGPVRSTPSWQWVGQDVGEVLSRDLAVEYFEDAAGLPDGSLVFWIKAPPEQHRIADLERKNLRIVFLPVDVFLSQEHIEQHRDFLSLCSVIALHNKSLNRYFDPAKLRYVDHYNKYGIAPASRLPGNVLLWVGGFQYAPYVLKYLLESKLSSRQPVAVLSDYNNPAAVRAASTLACTLGLGTAFSERSFDGLAQVTQWHERTQAEMLRTCRGAFDIKGTSDFNQFHKPPTKLQKYICSLVPTAINAGLPFVEAINLQIPDPTDVTTWFSADYLDALKVESDRLREALSLRTVAGQYLGIARELGN